MGQDLGYSSTSNLHHDNSTKKADLVLTYTFQQGSSQCPVVTTDIYFYCNQSVPVGVSNANYTFGIAPLKFLLTYMYNVCAHVYICHN